MEDRLVEELVAEIAGQDVVPLVQLILGKKDVNEFKIAENMEITVNQVRNMLYRLSAHNLVDFMRKKDKRKGWYIYYWTFDLRKAHDLILALKRKKLYIFRKRIEKEKNDAYLKCSNNCVRFDTLNAMEYGFRCPECGELLIKEDADKVVAQLEKQMVCLEADIEEEEKRVFKESRKKVVKKKVKKKSKNVVKKKAKKKKIPGKKIIKKKKKKVVKKKTKKFNSKKRLPLKKHSKKPVKRKLKKLLNKLKKKRR